MTASFRATATAARLKPNRSRSFIPTLNNADSWDSQKPTNLNRWGKPEVCDGFGDLLAIRF
jgi:hypothetical protein